MANFFLSAREYEAVLRHDLMSFVERSFLELNPQAALMRSPHLEVLASKLEACRQGQYKRLIVNLPPRSLKSNSVSVAFPAWLLGHDPTAQIICASYGQDLADKLARDCRTLMLSPFYRQLFPKCLLSAKQAVNDFVTTMQGVRMATSVGGVLTGRGAEYLILDDPLKPDEALSETRRTSVNDWYDNTLLSRLNSKKDGVIIIVMQRLHQDDLVGHVLGQEDWEVVSFPAIAVEDETHEIKTIFGKSVYRRATGDILHPERESAEVLAKIRSTIGEYNFQSQYQQTPTPLGGSMVKTDWIKYYDPGDLPHRFYMTLQSWDTANKSGDLNDYSVCTTWGVYDGKYWLLDVFRKRLNYPDLKRAVEAQAKKFHPNRILIEDKASGTQLIQDLKGTVYRIRPYKPIPGMDKIMRLHARTAEFENGKVLLPRSAPWLAEYVNEITSFPGSKFDDQVDSTTQALDDMTANRSLETWAKLAG